MDINLKKFFKNKKILVTGATGFKGSWLCLWLYILGSKVIGTGYNPNKNNSLFKKLNLKKKIKLKIIDVRDKKKIENVIKKYKPEIIFHLAAQPLIYEGYNKPYETYITNSIGTLNILECIRKENLKFIKSLVCVTSDKCYESNNSTTGFKETDKLGGVDPYSGSKANAEIIVRTYRDSFFNKKFKNLGVATARAGNVIGGGDWSDKRLIPDVVKSILSNNNIILRNPNFNRPWQHVLEPLFGYLILAKKLYLNPKKYSDCYNFGPEKNTVTSVYAVVKKMIKFFNKGKIKTLNKNKFYEQENLQLNIIKSKKKLNWNPKFSMEKSIQITCDWYIKVLLKKQNPFEVTKFHIIDFMKNVK